MVLVLLCCVMFVFVAWLYVGLHMLVVSCQAFTWALQQLASSQPASRSRWQHARSQSLGSVLSVSRLGVCRCVGVFLVMASSAAAYTPVNALLHINRAVGLDLKLGDRCARWV